jgi:hypothetical protein
MKDVSMRLKQSRFKSKCDETLDCKIKREKKGKILIFLGFLVVEDNDRPVPLEGYRSLYQV